VEVSEREVLFKRYLPLVYRLARISISKGTAKSVREDLIQEGCIGLWCAVLRFEETKLPIEHIGAYARFWIRRHINRYLDGVYLKNRRESTGSDFMELSNEPVDSLGVVEDEVAVAVATLPELERELLRGWYGLDGGKPVSVAVLAAKSGFTPSKVRTRIERATRSLVDRMESRR